ncbi:hypothetical protein PPL_08335 [Heterostelium album PN500]|uniref:Uncharacterized protein n=1 Tax=Heterostelium pallidum (strain ATCC 26659 / Pp 5 / PN500) TaxID=670386 RepID=D3BHW7_HETP5|nr:hypothetical protein PPL_08335 [Heterostelium album PN500]EFA78867.1 hypothetical protein PPL_08335 [Heterostelium album PN500]|eukprot:XP_020430991.1 hypothetical protein PPL_08335 [Heterostelium album PN500]
MILLPFEGSDDLILYDKIFTIKSLRNIFLPTESFYAKKLQRILSKDTLIESFSCRTPLGLLDLAEGALDSGDEDDKNKIGEDEDECYIFNTRRSYSHMLRPKIIESTSLELSKALSINTTLTSLTITCQVISDSFFQTLSHSNQTISHLSLTECGIDQLVQIANLLESNKTIRRLGIAFHRNYCQQMIGNNTPSSFRIKMDKDIELFSLSLLKNKTISRLDIQEYQPYTIRSHIDDCYYNHRTFQELPSFYPTLKEYAYDYTDGQEVFDSLENFKQLNYNRSIIEYSLVSKEWFNYISKRTDRFYAEEPIDLSLTRSIYQFSNITHLYADFSPEPSWLKNFLNLKRLVINTDDVNRVKQLVEQFPSIKLEVFVKADSEESHTNGDLSSIGYDTLEFVHLYVMNIYSDVDHDNLKCYYKKYVKPWRTNSIYFVYDEGGHDGIVPETQYGYLFEKVKSLRNIIIPCDPFLAFLLRFAVTNDTLIDSFKCSTPLGILDALNRSTLTNSEDEEEAEDEAEDKDEGKAVEVKYGDEDEEEYSHAEYIDLLKNYKFYSYYCRCFQYDTEADTLVLSKLTHWKRFCLMLGSNTRLKSREDDYHGHFLLPKSIESTSLALCEALSVNTTLTSLTISCQVLSDSFFQTLPHSNQTINHLSLTECGIDQLVQLTNLLESNKSIKRLGITFHKRYYQEIMRKQLATTKSETDKAIESFSLSLLNNKTITRLDIKEYQPYTIRSHIESLFNGKDRFISTKFINQKTNSFDCYCNRRTFQELPSFYPTLKEYAYDYTDGQEVFDSLENFKQLNYNRSIIEYSLVSKEWFNYISKRTDRFYATLQNDLSLTLSIYQFSNITHLYADFLPESSWLKNFTNLKRLIINTDDVNRVKQLVEQFPSIKLEVFVKADSEESHINGDLSSIGYDTLEFVHLYVVNIDCAVDHDNIDRYYKKYVEPWRTNSIYFVYDEGHHDGIVPDIEYGYLFKEVKSLRNIIIPSDRFLAFLLKYAVINDTLIDSFKCSTPLGILDALDRSTLNNSEDEDEADEENEDEDKDEDEFDHEEYCDIRDNGFFYDYYCRCFQDDTEAETLVVSKLKHWKRFCLMLGSNTRLKYLELKNYCKSFNNIRSREDDYHGHFLLPKSIESTSLALCEALSVNTTLTSLTISCQVLSDSFYQTLSHSNQTINHLSLTECGVDQLVQLTNLLESNKSLKRLGITFHKRYYQEIMSKQLDTKCETDKAIESFSLSLLNNKTITRLDIKEYQPYTIKTRIESLFNGKDRFISTKFINQKTNSLFFK